MLLFENRELLFSQMPWVNKIQISTSSMQKYEKNIKPPAIVKRQQHLAYIQQFLMKVYLIFIWLFLFKSFVTLHWTDNIHKLHHKNYTLHFIIGNLRVICALKIIVVDTFIFHRMPAKINQENSNFIIIWRSHFMNSL